MKSCADLLPHTSIDLASSPIRRLQAVRPLPPMRVQTSALSSTEYRASIPQKRLVDYGLERLGALLSSMNVEPTESPLVHAFQRMLEPWGARRIGTTPWYRSDASNDFTPFEFSMAFGHGVPELRFMVEPLGEEPHLRSNLCAGRVLGQRLASEFGVYLGRLRQIESLFLPEDPQGVFSTWYAVCWRPGGALEFKVYLNIHARGREQAPALLGEAMARLGFGNAWRSVYGSECFRGPALDEPVYFSLDLTASSDARIKVYCRHYQSRVSDLERIASLARNHQAGDAELLCELMTGNRSTQSFIRKPPITCFSFVDPSDHRPAAVTLHFPAAAYAPQDSVVRDRTAKLLAALGLPTRPYESAIAAFATRPLSAGLGVQSYASFRREKSGPRITAYLGPEAYSVTPPVLEDATGTGSQG